MDTNVSSLPTNHPFKNYRPWLIAFGLTETAIACGLLLIAALFFFAAPRMPIEGVIFHLLPPAEMAHEAKDSGISFVCLAILFLSVGIGSIRCRNWARILIMMVSTAWLGIGLLAISLLVVQAHSHGTGIFHEALVAPCVGLVAMMVVLPAAFLFFYSRKGVRAIFASGAEP